MLPLISLFSYTVWNHLVPYGRCVELFSLPLKDHSHFRTPTLVTECVYVLIEETEHTATKIDRV
jgi:hypothetical protein